MKIKSGEIIAINLTDEFETTYSVTVRLAPNNQEAIAYPLNANIKRVPLVGESVIIVPATLAEGSFLKRVSRLYYIDVISIQQNIHHNALPTVAGVPSTQKGGDYSSTSAGNPNSEGGDSSVDLAKENPGFVERTDVGSLQPFLGDLLIEGRFGHSLRFGYSPEGADTTEDPSWNSSTPEDPITILSNGRKSGGSYNKFIIENVDEDLSSIWLTSSQKVKLSVSNKLPSDVDAQSKFDKPSVILNSDRIILNSKSDWVVLSGAKSVALTTPSWAMDMDKLFTIIEGLIQQVADLTSAKATFATGVGPTGPATNVADVTKLLTDLKKMVGSSTPPLIGGSPAAVAAAAAGRGGGSGGTAGNASASAGPGSEPVDQNNVPNANRLRAVIRETGNLEKGIELSNGGDLTAEMADAGIAVTRKIKELMPTVVLRFTGGNDAYHHKLKYVSRHATGRGLDFTVTPSNNATLIQVQTILKGFAAGNNPNFRFINEYATPTKAATGNHFHMSWGGGSEAQWSLNNAIAEAASGNLTTFIV